MPHIFKGFCLDNFELILKKIHGAAKNKFTIELGIYETNNGVPIFINRKPTKT